MKNLKFSVLALCVGAFLGGKVVAQVPSYVPTNGLVGWWPFNGNANDESVNGNNGTNNGATLTTDRFGNTDKAYSFDSDAQNINCGNSTTLGLTTNTNLTLSFWTVSPNNRWPYISKYQNNVPSNCNYGVGNGNQNYVVTGNGQNNYSISISNTSSWVHFCFVYSGNNDTLKVYLNGNLIQTNQIILANNISTSNLIFGPRFNPSGTYFAPNGNLDDIGIWNRSLTDCEIQDLYNAQLGSFSNANVSITPTSSSIGSNATLTVSSPVSSLQWQSNPGNMGWNNIVDNGNYSGANNYTLVVSNLQLSNHNQPFRVLACGDTSNIATINIADTCITNVTDTTFITVTDTNVVTVYDTLLTTVTDTLIINTTLSLPAPNNENTILIYPNPASDHITIDNGNFAAMAGYSIKIENNAGQQVFQSAINQQQFYVDLSTWTGNGLYFVHLIDSQNNTVTVRKIVLQ